MSTIIPSINAKIVWNSRNPNDYFFVHLLNDLMAHAPENSQAYYIWAEPIEDFEEMVESIDCDFSNVFLFIPDNLSLFDFNPWQEDRTWGVEIILNKIKKYPSTNFILITDVINLSSEIPTGVNLKIVNTEYLTMRQKGHNNGLGWVDLNPVINKNLKSSKTYISLNHRPAAHRISSVSYQLANNLQHNGVITVSKEFLKHISKYPDYMSAIPWHFTPEQESLIKPTLISGYELIPALAILNEDYDIRSFDNCPKNFKYYLDPLYQNSFVELVAETYYTETSFMCTEKMLNCIYGCNIPIMISSAGIVDHLRELGIDMFDDIVDHSYDKITNPLDRLDAIYKLNWQLLTDSNYAKTIWLKNKNRILANYNFAKDNMYNVIYHRATDQFNQALM